MTENTLTSHLCVGGPFAGQRFDAKPGSGFRVPVRESAEEDCTKPPSPIVTVRDVYYRPETFHTPQGDVTFWVPEGQTPLQTITLLLESFEEHSKLKRLGARILPAGATP